MQGLIGVGNDDHMVVRIGGEMGVERSEVVNAGTQMVKRTKEGSVPVAWEKWMWIKCPMGGLVKRIVRSGRQNQTGIVV